MDELLQDPPAALDLLDVQVWRVIGPRLSDGLDLCLLVRMRKSVPCPISWAC